MTMVLTTTVTDAHGTENEGKIFVVGALHAAHETTPGFSFDDLRRILDVAEPDVIVVETTPQELSARQDTKGRPEYPKVVWPFLLDHPTNVLAMEPGGQIYDSMVESASQELARKKRERPDAAAYWSSYQRSLNTVLGNYWASPSRAHDRTTDDLAKSWYVTQEAVLGPMSTKIQADWDSYMARQAVAVASSHPNARILVVASYRNRHVIEAALTAQSVFAYASFVDGAESQARSLARLRVPS